MPKHAKSSSSNQNRYSHPMGVSLAPAPNPTTDLYDQRLAMQEYYAVAPSSASLQPQLQQDYDATYAASTPTMLVPPVQHRPSSGAWTPQDDQTLLQARAQGLNWAQIQSRCFSNKTPNACRKRHERLMERKGADDGDKRKLERLAKEYMGMRKEIWGGLAARTGEKWNVVEFQCMSKGLKNLQSSARSAARRERHESGQPIQPGYDDDSGISGIGLTSVDELDPSYSSPETASSGGLSSFVGCGGMADGDDDDVAASAAASFAVSHSFGMQTLQHQPQQQHHQQHQQHRHQHQGHFYAPTGAHHGYTSSVSSTGSSGPIVLAASGRRHGGNSPSSPGPSYRRSNGQRLSSSAEKAVDVSVKRSRGGRVPQM